MYVPENVIGSDTTLERDSVSQTQQKPTTLVFLDQDHLLLYESVNWKQT